MNERSATVTLHLGRKGSGKSYAAKREAESWPELVSVWDPRAEWGGPTACDPPRRARCVVGSWDAFLEHASQDARADCYVFQLSSDHFAHYVSWCRRLSGLAVIDEAQLVAGSQGQDPAFVELATTCRHSRTSLLLCAQRPSTLHPNVRAQVDRVRIWRTIEPVDLRWIADSWGSELAASCPGLEGHDFVTWEA